MNDPISVDRARAAADSGDIQTALAILGEAIRQDPRNVDAWLLLSDVVEKPEQAEDCLYRVLQIDPDNPVAQRRLFGEPPDTEPGLVMSDEAIEAGDAWDDAEQEAAVSSAFYPADSVPDPSPPYAPEPPPAQAQTGSPNPASAMPLDDTPLKRPPAQKPGARKAPQNKKKGISKLEIFFIIIIGVLVLCLAVAGIATLGEGAALGPEPTSSPGEVTAIIYENIRASNANDIDAYMATIHTSSPSYNATREGLELAFSGEFVLSYGLSDVYVIEQGSSTAAVHFVLTTRRVGGSQNFRDNQVEGEMTLRTEDGAWKIYSQKVIDIEYLN